MVPLQWIHVWSNQIWFYGFTQLYRFFYLSNFTSSILKTSVPSSSYSFSKKNIEQLLFFSMVEVISPRFFGISYKIIHIGSGSKLISLQMLDINWTLPNLQVRKYQITPSSYLIWSHCDWLIQNLTQNITKVLRT